MIEKLNSAEQNEYVKIQEKPKEIDELALIKFDINNVNINNFVNNDIGNTIKKFNTDLHSKFKLNNGNEKEIDQVVKELQKGLNNIIKGLVDNYNKTEEEYKNAMKKALYQGETTRMQPFLENHLNEITQDSINNSQENIKKLSYNTILALEKKYQQKGNEQINQALANLTEILADVKSAHPKGENPQSNIESNQPKSKPKINDPDDPYSYGNPHLTHTR